MKTADLGFPIWSVCSHLLVLAEVRHSERLLHLPCGSKELNPVVLRQEVQWYPCRPICDAAAACEAGFASIWTKSLKQNQYFLKPRIATQKLSFLLWFAIYYASDWLYAKPGLGGNGKLNKPMIFLISKHLRRYKPECFCITLIQHYAPHCGGFMDFWS